MSTRWITTLLAVWLAFTPSAMAGEELPDALVQEIDEVQRLLHDADYTEAESQARELLERTEERYGAASLETAAVIDFLVAALQRLGKTGDGEAIELARRALENRRTAPGDNDVAIAAGLMSLGTIQWRNSDFESARQALEESIALYKKALGPDDLEVASAVENLGILLWTTGDYDEARTLIERTLAVRESQLSADHDLVGRTLNNLAILHWQMASYEVARSMYERSLRIREQTLGPDHPDTADVVENLALVLRAVGEHAEARLLFERALDIRKRALGPEHPRVASSLVQLGQSLRDGGDYEASRASLQRAVELYEKAFGPVQRRVAGALNNLATTLVAMGRYEEARKTATRALNIHEELIPDDYRVALSLGVLASAHAGLGDKNEARKLRERAVGLTERSLGADHPQVAYRLVSLARLQTELGELDAAYSSLERALAIRETQLGSHHPDVAWALGPLSFLEWQRGSLESARTRAVRAGRIQDSALRATLKALPEKQALFLASRSAEPEVILFSGLLAAGEDRAIWLEACWDWTLRRRGMVFDELGRRQRAAVVSGSEETLAAWERLSESRRRLAALWIRGPGEKEPEKYRALLADAAKAKQTAEQALASTTLGIRVSEPAPPRATEIGGLLPENGALVEVVRVGVSPPGSKDRTLHDVALILRHDGVADFVDLGPSERIDGLVDAWRDELERSIAAVVEDRGSAEAMTAVLEKGKTLRTAIWDPIARKIEKTEVVFLVPDGSLHRVDLRALPLDDARYLVESRPTLHLLSTGRDLVRFARGSSSPTGRGMLALGAPDFDATAGVRLAALNVDEQTTFRGTAAGCAALADRHWSPLPQSGREVRQIAELVPEGDPIRVLTGQQASEESFKREAPGRRALHVATHGFFVHDECASDDDVTDTDSPLVVAGENPLLFSGLVLAGANRADDDETATDDGILTAEELANLDLSGVQLAVLSACDTGRGTVAVGEGVFGLRRALEISGVSTVVMSLWRVPDQEARRWMKSFYADIFSGSTVPEASRAASVIALERLRDRERPTHPYLWAGFVTVGDWR